MERKGTHLILALALLVCLAAVSGCGLKKPDAKPDEAAAQVEEATPVMVEPAQVGSIRQIESLTGAVEPLRQVDVTCEVSGKVAWVGADVGDRIGRGQALVRLDTALVGEQLRQSQAAQAVAQTRTSQTRVGLQLVDDETAIGVLQAQKSLENARTRLRQARIAADLTHTRVEDAIAQAQIAANSARTRLAEVKAGSRNQEVAQASARVEAARSSLRLAKSNLTRAQNLANSGAISPSDLDAAQVAAENAQAQVNIAEQALDLAKEGSRSEEVRLAELSVSQAEQTLATAQAQRAQEDSAERDVRTAEVLVAQAEDAVRLAQSGRQRVKSSVEDVRAADASVRQARAGTSLSRTQLGKHTVYSPIAGEVAARNTEPGEAALPGTSLIRLVVMDTVRIVAQVSDLQVAHLRVGQVGQVSVDALPGSTFTGRITDIAPQAQEGKRVFAVRFEVPNLGRKLRAGMFARIDVVTAVHEDAVIIARDGLVERGDKRVVYAVENGAVKVHTVEVGAIDGARVEIVRGLKPDAVVVITGQSALADGQKVKPQDGAEAEKSNAAPPPES